MLTESEKQIIIELAEKYNVSRLLLFGSNTNPEHDANDIDLGVDGLANELFFKFYSELIFKLPKPVDLIDLSRPSHFTKAISEDSINLYDRTEKEN